MQCVHALATGIGAHGRPHASAVGQWRRFALSAAAALTGILKHRGRRRLLYGCRPSRVYANDAFAALPAVRCMPARAPPTSRRSRIASRTAKRSHGARLSCDHPEREATGGPLAHHAGAHVRVAQRSLCDEQRTSSGAVSLHDRSRASMVALEGDLSTVTTSFARGTSVKGSLQLVLGSRSRSDHLSSAHRATRSPHPGRSTTSSTSRLEPARSTDSPWSRPRRWWAGRRRPRVRCRREIMIGCAVSDALRSTRSLWHEIEQALERAMLPCRWSALTSVGGW